MLILHRDNLLDTERDYKIIIDEKYYSKIKCGEIKYISLEEGKYTMYLKMDWCRSNKVTFEVLNDKILRFDCGNSMRGWKILLFLIYSTILKNKYLFLKQR